ncbi:PREDICTED: uncharacterized protein LOC105364435 [Ceratosolen solmsi marchali]|uniref:Uncharacterized protein LOC105364435 n=1 Tax=Ceratosolen solmsi marchali TaxID=326594 RepID=A0AAJ6YMA9_9HYME|nr:PREDICTED: uncharacterized protein LOC105364435 [Ceratosolen solmsi marchali]
MNKTLTGINKMVNQTTSMNGVMKNLIRKRRRAPPDEDNDTFAPDTILIDTSKIDEPPRSMKKKVQDPTKSLMPMNEAIKLRNKQPIKPINFEVKMPHSANSDKLPPHGYFDNDHHYNYESRKLFRRPPNFPTSSPELTSKYKSRKKTVKKDLSSLKNDIFEQR